MEPRTEPTGHLSLAEARARLAERLAAVTRTKISGRVRGEDYLEIEQAIAECGKQADTAQAEVIRARQSISDAAGILAYLANTTEKP